MGAQEADGGSRRRGGHRTEQRSGGARKRRSKTGKCAGAFVERGLDANDTVSRFRRWPNGYVHDTLQNVVTATHSLGNGENLAEQGRGHRRRCRRPPTLHAARVFFCTWCTKWSRRSPKCLASKSVSPPPAAASPSETFKHLWFGGDTPRR